MFATFLASSAWFCVLSHCDSLQCSIVFSSTILELKISSSEQRQKKCNHFIRMFCCFLINFGTYRRLQWKVIPFKKTLCYFVGLDELLSTFYFSTCLHFLHSLSSSAILCSSSLHLRMNFKLHFRCCCEHENQIYRFRYPNNYLKA